MADLKVRRKSKSKPVIAPIAVKPTYEVPKWAGKPPQGMHLDVLKEGKLIEKFILDGKDHFFFGRQKEFIDFTIEHTSCSRVHAVMVYHKHLQRMFLIDLGSTHGTFLGSTRLEGHKPMQLPVDETISFGASTRTWALRERITMAGMIDSSLNVSNAETGDGDTSTNVSLLGLPEAENDLNDLTEFNTAHNRRLATLAIDEANLNTQLNPRKRRRSSHNVSFDVEDTIINPEDVDPTVGRFRNLISTEIIIPNKKPKPAALADNGTENRLNKSKQDFQSNQLYNDQTLLEPISPITLLPKISSAPEVEAPYVKFQHVHPVQDIQSNKVDTSETFGPQEPLKKRYIKEAWPGRKPKGHNLLSV